LDQRIAGRSHHLGVTGFAPAISARKKPRPEDVWTGLSTGQGCTMIRCLTKLAFWTSEFSSPPDSLTGLLRKNYPG
jgi:hypothetical protein